MKFKQLLKRGLVLALCACLLVPTYRGTVRADEISESNAADDYANTWTNTGNQAVDIVQVALTQVGYTEYNNNFTKYNTWYYGTETQMSWCGIFIAWCANQADIPTSIMKRSGWASGFSVSNMTTNPYGTAYTFSSTTAKVGDVIFVDNNNDGISNHTGLVYAVDSDYIYTVEGNSSDQVALVKYHVSNGYRNNSSAAHIIFYARPAYTGGNIAVDTSKSTSTASGTPYTVTASSLNVRSGAGTTYAVLTAVAKDTTVYVTEIDGDWAKIIINGQTGWVSMQYLMKETTGTTTGTTTGSTGTTTTETETGTEYKITASSLNVRSGAGTGYNSIGAVSKDTVVTVYEESNGWGRISLNGNTGWISLTYASKVTDSTETDTTGTTTGTTGTTDTTADTSLAGNYTITISSLTVRSDASISSSAIGMVVKDQVVAVTETKATSDGRTWGKISYNGKTGWISLKYASKVTTTGTTTGGTTTGGTTGTTTGGTTTGGTTGTTTGGTTTGSATETTTGDSYKITATSLNVRSGAGTGYSLVTSVKKDTVVTVTETAQGSDGKTWGKITVNGKTGWISLSYASKVATGTATGTTGTTTGTAYKVTASSLKVRKGAGTSYASIGSITKGTIVTVTATSGSWGKISYNGQDGWISLDYCSKQ